MNYGFRLVRLSSNCRYGRPRVTNDRHLCENVWDNNCTGWWYLSVGIRLSGGDDKSTIVNASEKLIDG